MSVTVTLDIYSGLPNPSWELTDEQVSQLVAALRSAKGLSLSKPAAVDGRLGYRGFRIESIQEKGLEEMTLVHGGLADISRSHPSLVLGDTELEQWLLHTGEGSVKQATVDYVASRINLSGAEAQKLPSLGLLAEPPFDPGKWNNNPTVLERNNCYNYANDKITNTFAQPGRGTGHIGPDPPTCPGTGAAAQSDGQIPIPNPKSNAGRRSGGCVGDFHHAGLPRLSLVSQGQQWTLVAQAGQYSC